MIRRSPTRIELKLEDIQEFDFVQRSDKKKHPGLIDHANMSMSTQAKLLRHERIGYRSSTLRSGASTQTHATITSTAAPQPSGSGGPGPSGASNVTPVSQAFSTPSTSGTGIVASTPMETGAGNASVSMDVTPVAGASESESGDTTAESTSTVAVTAREELSEMDLVEYNSSLYTSAQMSIDDD